MELDPRLEWFRMHAGIETDFPEPLPTGELLATHAKGIYKPAGTSFAVSIRTQLRSKYEDGIFLSIFNRGWAFAYHQETDKRLGSNLFTNKAIEQNIIHSKPVGVLQEIANVDKAGSKYFIHGLAMPIHKAGEYFILCDLGSAAAFSKIQILNEFFLANANMNLANENDFDTGLEVKTYRSIIARQGQGRFRREIVNAYEGICAISGETTLEVLDAAHINPYDGKETNTVNNGVLIRTDLHNLFDFNLLAINPENFQVYIHNSIKSDFYLSMIGKKLNLPTEAKLWPDADALKSRWTLFSKFDNLRNF